MGDRSLTIDLITERPSDGSYVLVLVEEGPWLPDQLKARLRRIQDRLYDCVDAAIDGHLAARYPASRGRPVIVRLDCYDAPRGPVRDFMGRFVAGVGGSEEIQRDLAAQGFVASLAFEYNERAIAEGRSRTIRCSRPGPP